MWILWIWGSTSIQTLPTTYEVMQRNFNSNVREPLAWTPVAPAVSNLVNDTAANTATTLYWPNWKLPTVEQVTAPPKGSIISIKV